MQRIYRLKSNGAFHYIYKKGERVKGKNLVLYFAKSNKGLKAGFKALKEIPITKYFKYAKPIGECVENNKTFVKYLIYKETHTVDSAEMARLIDGTIEEAKQLGIETLTPIEIENLKGYKKED